MFFPISHWNLTGKVVRRAFAYETKAEAEQAGRAAETTYKDQKFSHVFEGTWEQYNQEFVR